MEWCNGIQDPHSSLTSGVLLVFILCIAVLVLGLHLLLHPGHLGAWLQAPGGRKKDPVSCLITGVGGTSWDRIGEAYFTSEILNFPIFGPGH